MGLGEIKRSNFREKETTLQDFTVLPTAIFRRCVIELSSVKYLPTILPTEYSRRNTFCRWFHIPFAISVGNTKKTFTDGPCAPKKKSFPLGIYRRNIVRRCYENTDGLDPSAKVSVIYYTDRIFPSVNSSINLYRRIMSVGEYVGDGGRHCPMPTELFRR